MPDPTAAIAAWDWPDRIELVPVASGLINQTWLVRPALHPEQALGALQWLNTKVFTANVHEDIEAVTAHLDQKGLVTPRLVRTREGALWAEVGGEVWRRLTWVGDRTVEKLVDPADAHEAGRLVAAFHAAVADLDWTFRCVRAGFHDTAMRVRQLEQAVGNLPSHRLYDQVAPLAQALIDDWARWDGPSDLPRRIVHGDLKISNVRFDGPRALALIDLDTLAHGTLDAELGDAFRSWCNPASEDAKETRFELPFFAAGIQGYAERAEGVTDAEWASIVPGIERIALELAARFATDALEERYFGWDARFGGRGEHNLLRARGQLALARSVRGLRRDAERAVVAARSR